MPDFSKIKAFAFDVDGVFTDGSILCVPDGELYRTFDAKDCFGIRMAKMNGYPCAVITGASSETIVPRFLTMGLKEEDIYLHSRDKSVDFIDFCKKNKLNPEDIAYFGDDMPDIPVLKLAGIGICPSDAADDVKAVADFVSPLPGGKGLVRKTLEMIMKSQGRWNLDIAEYKAKF